MADQPHRRFGPETIERLRALLPDERLRLTDPAARAAAVLIPLFLVSDEVHLVLTKRSADLRQHRGEVCFPGGAHDPEDGDLRVTALREAEEEVGLDPSRVEVIGLLEDMPTAVSGYVIRPYVGVVPHPYAFQSDHREVERILTPPLGWFADPARRREEVWERDGVRYPMTFFDVDGEVVWGATGRLLVALLDRIEGRPPTGPPFAPLVSPDLP